MPKNYNLQPEPALGQVLGLPDIRGYTFDVQIVSAPVTEGSLSSCPPAEAVTWGKVDRDTYQQTTESVQADYSMVMPFLVKALLDNRAALRPAGGGDRRGGALRGGSPRPPATCARARATASSTTGTRLVAELSRSVGENGEWLREDACATRWPSTTGRERPIA